MEIVHAKPNDVVYFKLSLNEKINLKSQLEQSKAHNALYHSNVLRRALSWINPKPRFYDNYYRKPNLN